MTTDEVLRKIHLVNTKCPNVNMYWSLTTTDRTKVTCKFCLKIIKALEERENKDEL